MTRTSPSPLRSRVLVGAALTAALAGAPVAAAAAPSDTYESDIIRFTNAERTSRSLVAVRAQSCLDGYAERLAAALVREQRLRHSDLSRVLAGCKLRSVGENVAMGYPNGKSVVTQGWMKSTGHRANILTKGYRLIGSAAAQDKAGRWWAVEIFGS